jgi:uncharacterized protein YkwD
MNIFVCRKPWGQFPIYLIAMVLAVALTSSAQNPIDADGEEQILALVNHERTNAGLPPLNLDSRLTQAARKHCQRMIDQDSLVHQLPGEDVLLLRLTAENVRTDHDGENIALNGDVESAHVALMQSPQHRANILNPQFNAIGVGVLRAGELIYVTEDFAHVLADYSDFEADAAAQQAIVDYVRSINLPVPPRKARTQLTHMACDMAHKDKLDSASARDIPGVVSAVGWTATDLHVLPAGLKKILSQPVSGYSLGVCWATSTSQPGGVYWLLFITY